MGLPSRPLGVCATQVFCLSECFFYFFLSFCLKPHTGYSDHGDGFSCMAAKLITILFFWFVSSPFLVSQTRLTDRVPLTHRGSGMIILLQSVCTLKYHLNTCTGTCTCSHFLLGISTFAFESCTR
eukprot:scpid66610/ scgid23200/ 